jgi:hypothetical protein
MLLSDLNGKELHGRDGRWEKIKDANGFLQREGVAASWRAVKDSFLTLSACSLPCLHTPLRSPATEEEEGERVIIKPTLTLNIRCMSVCWCEYYLLLSSLPKQLEHRPSLKLSPLIYLFFFFLAAINTATLAETVTAQQHGREGEKSRTACTNVPAGH